MCNLYHQMTPVLHRGTFEYKSESTDKFENARTTQVISSKNALLVKDHHSHGSLEAKSSPPPPQLQKRKKKKLRISITNLVAS